MTDRIKWLNEIKRLTKENRIVIIQGLRRTGKTTIMMDIMNDINSQKTHVTIMREFGLLGNNDLEWATTQLNKFESNKNIKYFLFLDEFQDFPEWNKFFKTIYDAYENVSILSTGSTSHNTTATNKTEGGRYKVVKMNTLSYLEYENILKENTLFDNKISDLSNYISMGSFPIKSWSQNILVYRSSVNENIFEKIKSSELLERSNLSSFIFVNSIIKHIIANLGGMMNASSLSKELGINKVTCQKAIEYLKSSYIISQVNSFHKQSGKATMWENKFYLEDQSFYLMNDNDRTFYELLESRYEEDKTYASFIFENAVYNQLRRFDEYYENELSSCISFLKSKDNDIDFVFSNKGNNYFIEVKLSNNTDCLSKQQSKFSSTNKLNVIYIGETKVIGNVKYISIFDIFREQVKLKDFLFNED